MSRRFAKWPKVFALAVFTSLCLFLATVFLVQRYPWQTIYVDFASGKVSRFLSPWPQSSLDEEMQERKRLKRFAKSEISRRFGLQLRRMDTLHFTLFDPFLDSGVTFHGGNLGGQPEPGTLFDWPSLSASRFAGEPAAQKEVRYFAVPTQYGVGLKEGFVIEPGEEFRFSYPVVQNRRTLDFEALPLTAGNLRCSLGQFSWSRNFADVDIHVLQKVSIPLNDTTATSLRCNSLSLKTLLLNASVEQWDRSARSPIMVSSLSKIWSPSFNLLETQNAQVEKLETAANENVDEKVVDVGNEEEKSPLLGDDLPPPNTADAEDSENKPKIADPKEAAGLEQDVPQQTKLATAKPDILDPLEQTENKQKIMTKLGNTAALGYNVLLLQLAEFPLDMELSSNNFKIFAPNLFGLLSKSARAEGDLDRPRDHDLNFFLYRSIVLGETGHKKTSVHKAILRDLISRGKVFNLYSVLRNYGYKVYASVPATFIGLPPEVSFGREVPSLGRRWLQQMDWDFVQHNKELEEQNTPVTGLDAIFQTNNIPLQSPLLPQELAAIGDFSAMLARQDASFADWKSNEFFMPDMSRLYLPSATYAFQEWLKENSQSRFFSHLVLDASLGGSRPSLKDLLTVLKASRKSLKLSPAKIDSLTKLVLLDRAIGQILDALRVRKLTHRTIVAVVLPGVKSPNENRARASLSFAIPGVIPKDVKLSSDIDSFVATIFASVGVPLTSENSAGHVPNLLDSSAQNWENQGLSLPPPKDPELPVLPTVVRSEKYYIYQATMHAGLEGCVPFYWVTSHRVFGIEATHPIFEEEKKGDQHRFKIFPCAIPGETVRMTWMQLENAHESLLPSGGALGQENKFVFAVTGKEHHSSGGADRGKLPALFFGQNLVQWFSHNWNGCKLQNVTLLSSSCGLMPLQGEFLQPQILQRLIEGKLALQSIKTQGELSANRTWIVLTRNEVTL